MTKIFPFILMLLQYLTTSSALFYQRGRLRLKIMDVQHVEAIKNIFHIYSVMGIKEKRAFLL